MFIPAKDVVKGDIVYLMGGEIVKVRAISKGFTTGSLAFIHGDKWTQAMPNDIFEIKQR